MMNGNYLRERLPTSAILLDLEPEELGAVVVEAIRRRQNPAAAQRFSMGQVAAAFYRVGNPMVGYPPPEREAVEHAIVEAWSWLEAQGLLVWSDFVNGPNGFRRLSRRAEGLRPEDFADFSAAQALPREQLHLRIRDRVWSDFVRGHYDSAVLFAARNVEIAVREAALFDDNQIGVAMMRTAFNPDAPGGPLTDMNAHAAERRARADLFAGFIGAYKNPLSHRDLNMTDPSEAIEVIMLASHLLRIVDLRTPPNEEAEDPA